MKKLISLIIFLLFIFSQLLAQTIDFKGKVICKNKPISFAIVSIKELTPFNRSDPIDINRVLESFIKKFIKLIKY